MSPIESVGAVVESDGAVDSVDGVVEAESCVDLDTAEFSFALALPVADALLAALPRSPLLLFPALAPPLALLPALFPLPFPSQKDRSYYRPLKK